MEILTRSQLEESRSSFEKARAYGALNEAVRKSHTRSNYLTELTVFLSHKHDQSNELTAAIALLEGLGVSVYVDWMDEQMPKNTSGETATKLKRKIAANRKFILLATEQAINSKWCNWELGLGDAAKYPQHIALLPVKENYGEWSGSEYMQIYPVIGRRYSSSSEYYDVQLPNKTTIDIATWLKQ